LTVLVLLSMPRFYGYTQWILLDIAVGAFSTLALVSFGLCFLKTEAETRPGLLLSCFYLASAGAFLTKGLAGLFHIGVTVLGFCASRGVGTSCASS
jgi:4-amino-4-deoxy-L-arabinose transferase-like glycosyltransferase